MYNNDCTVTFLAVLDRFKKKKKKRVLTLLWSDIWELLTVATQHFWHFDKAQIGK